MKLPKPKMTLQEIIKELDNTNGNLFQLKQFSRIVCELIDKDDVTIQQIKHVRDVFRPMEAIENLDQNQ